MTTTKSTEHWALLVSNIEALRHLIEGDQELDIELAEWERIALIALQESQKSTSQEAP